MHMFDEGSWLGRVTRVTLRLSWGIAVLSAAGCSLTSGPTDKPTEARVQVEGTSPHPLQLITSTDFFEQVNLTTGDRYAIVNRADTVEFTPPYDHTFDLGSEGSFYVKLNNPLVPTASVRMRVNLDGGQSYDQSATLSDNAALIYYFIFTEYKF